MTRDQADSGVPADPTVLRMLVGGHLRRLREAKGVTRDEAAYLIRGSESKISRMELGRVSFKERDIADLLSLYGVTDEKERERVLQQTREANKAPWWQVYNDVAASWFQSYLGLEAGAQLIRSYEIQFVPGLLQTKDYARAVVQLGYGNAPVEENERRVRLRMERQQVLSKSPPTQLWAVLDEAVLRRPIGGWDVMRAQVQALMDATRMPNVRLQIMPFGYGGHAAAGGAFTILRFPEQDLPDIVYLEQLTGGAYVDKREDVDQYALAMERLCVEADEPGGTVAFLEGVLADMATKGH